MRFIKYISESKKPKKWVIKIKAPEQKEWRSKIYDDFNEAYDDFGDAVKKIAKKFGILIKNLEYRYIDNA